MQKNNKRNVHTLVLMALLIAMEIVLSRFLSFAVWNMKIGFAFIPVVIAAILLGPLKAAEISALADLIGAFLFPIGAYFPGFTLTAALMGCVFGLFLHEKQSLSHVISAVAVNQLLLSLLLNTLWISILYDAEYIPLLITRLTQCAVLIPVQILVIGIMTKSFGGYMQRKVRQWA